MKKNLLTLSIAIASYCSYAQNTSWSTTGNIGIGTTSPAASLEIKSQSQTGVTGALRVTSAASTNRVAELFENGAGVAGLQLFNGSDAVGAFFTGSATGNSYIVNNNFGIGTPSPSSLGSYFTTVDVRGANGGGVRFGTSSLAGEMFATNAGATIGTSTNDPMHLETNNTARLTVSGGGNVGIGTTSPTRRLDILSGSGVTPLAVVGPAGYMLIDNTGAGYNYYQANVLHQFQGTSNNPIMTLYANGNVGIGTIDPQGYMLAVNGSAIATSVTVKLHGSWPDYVFKPKYNLLPLAQVKTYIDQNQHLPDMPSEQEVAKNGINLGEIVRVQTKKIEELTLYLIEQNNKLAEQQKINESLQLQINQLANKK